MAAANIVCPKCGTSTAPGVPRCPRCTSPLDSDATINFAAEPTLDVSSQPTADLSEGDRTRSISDTDMALTRAKTWASVSASDSSGLVSPGSVIGDRYEIIRTLGEGGMGAVYEARDREVDRTVALKVIKPELASNQGILQMFKQELVLARQVTHQNVIRIYDLGLAGGLRFITMQFVEGQDLKSLLTEKGKLTPEEATEIMVQTCAGLDAAHKQNVVHRDLKPQNIMIDKQGNALVMDFGLALDTATSNTDGILMGTPQYMSPEQARREEVDARSDLFSVGVVFYSLLTGSLPVDAPTLKAALKQRATEQIPPPIEKDPTIPKALNDVIVKCIALDRDNRYQSAAEVIYDLQVWQGVIVPSNTKRWKQATAGVAVLLVATVGFITFTILRRPVPAPKPVTLLVADFANHTGEKVLDGTLEPLFVTNMEGASFINAYNRGQARQEASQMRPGASVLNEDLARLVAVRDGLNVVISGDIAKSGDAYSITAKAVDAVTGKPLADSQARAASKEKLASALVQLAQPLRKALGDRTPSSSGVEAAETFSAASLEAAQDYSLGQEAQFQGKYDEAMEYFKKAVALDPNMGRAYSGMGVIYRNRGARIEAEQNLKIALSKIGNMSQRERYRTRGAYYVTIGNYEKAADEYKTLLSQFPADNVGHANLSICDLYARNLTAAIDEGRKAVEIYPQNVNQRNNLASYLMYAGKLDEAVREADKVLKVNPNFERAYVVKALAALAGGKPEEAAAEYEKAGKVSARGASYRSIGLADLAMFEGRTADAIVLLQEGIKVDLAGQRNEWMAEKQVALAQALLMEGKRPAAAVAAGRAVEATKEVGLHFLAARVFVEAGQEAKARAEAQDLARKFESEPQAYAKLIEGELALKKGNAREAVQFMQEARKLGDLWIGRYDLGRAYLAGEAYTEADSEFDACLRRRGEAASLFVDVMPTYSYLPPLYYYIGRAQEGLSSPSATETYKKFLAIKAKAAGDPMVADARKRIAGK